MKIHFGTPTNIKTLADAIKLYGPREFESPTRSTVPMLSLLSHAPSLFEKIIDATGFPLDYDLHLEYTVGPFDGKGKASHTDVMLTSKDQALAIEAKWTEPMYPSIDNWPKRGGEKTDNQRAVLGGWLRLLPHPDRKLNASDFGDAVYQMVHRAASAAYVGKRPRLAYFVFTPSPTAAAKPTAIFAKLTDLWCQLGKPAEFPFYLVEIELQEPAIYKAIRKLPRHPKEAISEAVSAALQDSKPLFEFVGGKIRTAGRSYEESIYIDPPRR